MASSAQDHTAILLKISLEDFLKKATKISSKGETFCRRASLAALPEKYDKFLRVWIRHTSSGVSPLIKRCGVVGKDTYTSVDCNTANQSFGPTDGSAEYFFFFTTAGHLGFYFSPNHEGVLVSSKIGASIVKLFTTQVSSLKGIPPILSVVQTKTSVKYVFDINKSQLDDPIPILADFDHGNIITLNDGRVFVFPVSAIFSARRRMALKGKMNLTHAVEDIEDLAGYNRKRMALLGKSSQFAFLEHTIRGIIQKFKPSDKMVLRPTGEIRTSIEQYLSPDQTVLLYMTVDLLANFFYTFDEYISRKIETNYFLDIPGYKDMTHLSTTHPEQTTDCMGTHIKSGKRLTMKFFGVAGIDYYDSVVEEYLISKKLHKLGVGPKVLELIECMVNGERHICMVKDTIDGESPVAMAATNPSPDETVRIMKSLNDLDKIIKDNHLVASLGSAELSINKKGKAFVDVTNSSIVDSERMEHYLKFGRTDHELVKRKIMQHMCEIFESSGLKKK